MRSYFLALMGMLLVSCLHAEVVLTKYGGTDGVGQALSSSNASSIAYVSGFAGNFTNLKLRIFNNDTPTITAISLSFGLTSAASDLSNVSVSTTIGSASFADVDFNLGSGLTFANGSAGNLYFKLVSTTGGGIANWASTTNSVTENLGWTGGATTGPNNGQYELSATAAVPEPGTLLLGGIAAVTGGTGVWWKRRKKATCKVIE